MAGTHRFGKLVRACAFRHRPELDAAILAHYGVDIMRDPPTPRRLAVLVSHLPAGVIAGRDRPDDWSQESHLLAGIVDAVNALTAVTLRGLGARGVRAPKPTPRPGRRTAARATETASDGQSDAGRLRPVPGGIRGLAAALAGSPGVVYRETR